MKKYDQCASFRITLMNTNDPSTTYISYSVNDFHDLTTDACENRHHKEFCNCKRQQLVSVTITRISYMKINFKLGTMFIMPSEGLSFLPNQSRTESSSWSLLKSVLQSSSIAAVLIIVCLLAVQMNHYIGNLWSNYSKIFPVFSEFLHFFPIWFSVLSILTKSNFSVTDNLKLTKECQEK